MIRPFATVLLALLVYAAAADAAVVWEDEESWVRIEEAGKGAPPNDHPADFTASEVASLLGRLEVRRRRGEEAVPLFAMEELERITPHLAEALNRAGAGEDIHFRSRGAHSESAFIGRKLFVTQGLMFVRDDRLNIIFNRLQEEARKRNFYGQRDEDFYSAKPPSRKREADLRKVSLLQGDGVVLRLEGGSVRGDWVEIATDPAGYRAGTAGTDRTPAAGAAAAATAASQSSGESTPADREAAPPAPAATSGDYVPLEERLRQLKRLHAQGLITEEVYQEKMRELLSEL